MELDTRLTFESFVTGPSNRLAAAAAKRVSDSPGTAYNPLFIYGASGLGKTHLLMAIGNGVRRRQPGTGVAYASMEPLAEELADPADGEAFRARLQSARLLLLDDAQVLADRRDLQEDLLAVWDVVAARGGQMVLCADRPPSEIGGLDRRLVTRFSGGLVADISPPTYDERVAIVGRKAQEGGHRLATGVQEVVARVAFGNIREVHGALNRILAVQEVEQRLVAAADVHTLLEGATDKARTREFTTFVAEIEGAVDDLVERRSPEQLLAEAILRYEGEGYATARLEGALQRVHTPELAEQVIRGYGADVTRLEKAVAAIRALDQNAPDLARVDVLLDPDRVTEAEELVEQVRARQPGARPVTNGRMQEPGNRVAAAVRPSVRDAWFLSREKVVWSWPYAEDWIVQEAD